MKKINYKIVFVIWIALGFFANGYCKIQGDKIQDKASAAFWKDNRPGSSVSEEAQQWYYKKDYCRLITIVGGILIGGIGYLRK